MRIYDRVDSGVDRSFGDKFCKGVDVEVKMLMIRVL